MERTFLKDREWESIDGQLCLVTAFTPMAKVESGSVVAMTASTPYASVRLRRLQIADDDITAFITHKIDFGMLWAAFRERATVPGTRVKLLPPEELNRAGLGEDEEVWLVWTKKNYRSLARLFRPFLPRLIVMVSRKGTFELVSAGQIPPELKRGAGPVVPPHDDEDFSLAEMERKLKISKGGELTPQEHAHIEKLHRRIADLKAKLAEWQTAAAVMATLPLITWTPEVMRRTETAVCAPPPGTTEKWSDWRRQAEEQRLREEIQRIDHDLQLLEDPETFFSFGQMSFDGDGVEQDFVAAANWFRMAAEKGHRGAQHNLAVMYEKGEGVPQDLSEAVKWYQMAAEQGHPGSQNNLGALFERGEGVAQDHAAAIKWYQRAADGDDENARSNLDRLSSQIELQKYHKYLEIVCAFGDLMAAHSPLIGDCDMLPYPKKTILYAIYWGREHLEDERESATNQELLERCDNRINWLHYLLTGLVRDWHQIEPGDKDAVAKLAKCDSFPDWALPLKEKYINEEDARNQALEMTIRVMKDRIDREHGKGGCR